MKIELKKTLDVLIKQKNEFIKILNSEDNNYEKTNTIIKQIQELDEIINNYYNKINKINNLNLQINNNKEEKINTDNIDIKNKFILNNKNDISKEKNSDGYIQINDIDLSEENKKKIQKNKQI
jgi:hypothetical protein